MERPDPVTLSVAAVAGSTALAAGGSIMGGMQAQSAANIQAEQMQRQAALENQSAGAQISKDDVNAGRAIATGVANAGAAGVTQDTAAPVIMENASEAKIRDMYTRYSGQLAASGDLYQASLDKYQGKQAMWAGIFGAAKNILGGAGKIGGIGMDSMAMNSLNVNSGASLESQVN